MRERPLRVLLAGVAIVLTLGASTCGGGDEDPPGQCERSLCHAGEQQKPWPDCECYGVGGPNDPSEPQTPDGPQSGGPRQD